MTDTTTDVATDDTPAVEVSDVDPAPPHDTPEPEPDDREPDDDGDHIPERKLRRRARDAEQARDDALAELEEVRAQLDAARRERVELHAGRRIAQPSALWAAGVDVNTLFREDGTIDTHAVNVAVEDAATRLGLNRIPKPNPEQGAMSAPRDPNTFAAAFRLNR